MALTCAGACAQLRSQWCGSICHLSLCHICSVITLWHTLVTWQTPTCRHLRMDSMRGRDLTWMWTRHLHVCQQSELLSQRWNPYALRCWNRHLWPGGHFGLTLCVCVCVCVCRADFPALVVKASGLAAGKGVIVTQDKEEACKAVEDIMKVGFPPSFTVSFLFLPLYPSFFSCAGYYYAL